MILKQDNTQQPKSERLHDIELGVEKRKAPPYHWGATLYYMQYKDQLVLTGKINDVGAYTRTNIPNSYRIGIELQGNARIADWLNISANLTLSRTGSRILPSTMMIMIMADKNRFSINLPISLFHHH